MSTNSLSDDINDDNNEKYPSNYSKSANNIIRTDITNSIADERLFLGNFFGLFPEKYLKFFNFLFAQIFCTLFFALIYYTFMVVDYKNNFFVQQGYKDSDFLNHNWLIALIMSINFQTGVAYVDLKIKSILIRLLVTMQTIISCLLAFLFLL